MNETRILSSDVRRVKHGIDSAVLSRARRRCASVIRAASIAACIAVLLPAPRLLAWSRTGHTAINRAAIAGLPDAVPAFLKRQIDWIGARSTVPDSWRDLGGPYVGADEEPNHLWRMERLPKDFKELPPSRYAFAREVGDPARTGLLPYAIIENYERLQIAFASWRALRDRRQDTSFIELDAAFYAGWLGHYVGDGGMPLHTSENHEGWIGPNPKGYTPDHSIHRRFETQFVNLIQLTEGDISRHMTEAAIVQDPVRGTLAYLDRSHGRLEQVYSLDLQQAFADAANRDARELVYTCTGDAAAFLRDLIYTAWVTSEDSPAR